nr:RHS repeat-associated core domain-containing protein [Treponema putidum]
MIVFVFLVCILLIYIHMVGGKKNFKVTSKEMEKMKNRNLLKQQDSLTSRTAIEAEIFFAVCVIEKQALTGGKSLARENKCSKKIGAVLVQQADSLSFEAIAVPILVYFYLLCNNKSYKEPSGFLRAEPLSSYFEDRKGCRGGKKLLSDKSVFPPLTYHLQSAQFITNAKGEQYEHIEYTPYGELWIEETAPGIDKLPFRFTGKELDEETGLYYYGARYLDPKYSRWLSGDPALSDYIPKAPIDDEAKKHNENLPGMGGVFNVVNLHVYHYAGNNPIKYVDPTGMWINNGDGTYTAEKGDTLYGLYGDDWKEKSGFDRDPRTLQPGEIVGKRIIPETENSKILSNSIFSNLNVNDLEKFSITYNDGGIDTNGYTEVLTPKFNWILKPHGKTNLAEADIFYKHRNGVSPNTIVVIIGTKIKNIRNFYDRKGRYINSEVNYEEMFLLPGGASLK